MRLTDLWPSQWRIIEVDATSGHLGAGLRALGYKHFLAIASDERRQVAITTRFPQLERKVAVRKSREAVRSNNADVLILNGWSTMALGYFRAVRHSRCVALRLELTPIVWIASLMGLFQFCLGRVKRPQIVQCASSDGGIWLLVFPIRRPRPYKGVRRFVPHGLGVQSFLSKLQQGGTRHAVLRWFDELPKVAAGEDLDVLIADADLEQMRELLDSGVGIQPIDLYSVTGLPGSDFRGMPYFPPYLADELLDRVRKHREICSVPSAREHFLSMAYHALYHKGLASGIPAKAGQPRPKARADHDYITVLEQLASKLRYDVEITLEGLDAFLDAQGWRPPHDMLIRLARKNRWVRTLLQLPTHGKTVDDRIAVFLVREEALRRGGIKRAEQLIEKHGFQILESRIFDPQTAVALGRSVRGGNWGPGPWPISGGTPVAAIAVYDPQPIVPTRKEKKRFPFLANARLLCKEKIRDAFNEGVVDDQRCNVIHSSDNGREAMDYLRIAMPDRTEAILNHGNGQPLRRAA